MKRLFTFLTAILTILTATAQDDYPIILEQETFHKVNADVLTGVNIDPIAKDLSRNACARVKIKFANMTRAEIDALEIKFQSNTDLARQEVAQYFDNVLILEMTAKPITRFYVKHPTIGESNEVRVNLEGDCEYEMMAHLNQRFSIIVDSNVVGAEVFIDGVKRATTDDNCRATIDDVMVGGHTLKLAYNGLVAEQSIEVKKGVISFRQDIDQSALQPQYVVFSVTPENAVVIVDNQHHTLVEGMVMLVRPRGTYNYTVTAAGYHSQSGTFTVEDQKVEKIITLAADAANVTLTAPGGAEIWVNGALKGTGRWNGMLASGTYIFEARKAGYKSSLLSKEITSAAANQSYELSAPTPLVGKVAISSTPLMADVTLDGKPVGRTPIDIPNLIVGSHTVKISKLGYADNTQTVTISEGKTTTVNVTMIKGGGDVNIAGFDMVYVNGGTFTMGATAEQSSEADASQKPAHSVTVSDFYIAKYEVTQSQWCAIMGTNPSSNIGDHNPVESVSWGDIEEFIRRLNAKTGKNFRLPTEAEWEYAARGGSKTNGYKYSGSNSIGEVAWYGGNSSYSTKPVGLKSPNELGIFDMTGNVWEWCQDWYGHYSGDAQIDPTGPSYGSNRVVRGGGWRHDTESCRVSSRISVSPDYRGRSYGIRLALSANGGAGSTIASTPKTTTPPETINIGGIDMVVVTGGMFTMGATAEQGSDAESDEKPAHCVILSDYCIGKYEVTQAQWTAIMGSNPSKYIGNNNPVDNVSWNDIEEFIKKLNAQTGKRFRLPTEAEWEYAARGGNQSKGYKYSGGNNVDEVAWYGENSNRTTHPVGQKTPNELGIYDMSGNVLEWCYDAKDGYSNSYKTNPMGPSGGSYRVLRGGGWNYNYSAKSCRVSDRTSGYSSYQDGNYGFRLALQMDDFDSTLFDENTMIYVNGGTFTMGATAEQGSDAGDAEKPTHSVTLSDFYIGKCEVTQAQWKAVMGSNPSNFKGDNLPVENVSWDDVQEFIAKLNALTGKKFRLPTEAEWEYAARGGNQSKGYKYSGSNSINEVAWLNGEPYPVGQKAPNELGIYDMSGNVEEWCQDWLGDYGSPSQINPTGPSSGSRRVVRGGSWYNRARYCRVSYRNGYGPGGRRDDTGFRLVLSAE